MTSLRHFTKKHKSQHHGSARRKNGGGQSRWDTSAMNVWRKCFNLDQNGGSTNYLYRSVLGWLKMTVIKTKTQELVTLNVTGPCAANYLLSAQLR